MVSPTVCSTITLCCSGLSEPGLFLVRPNRELYFASVQTMPFARLTLSGLLGGLDFVISRNYPARGESVTLAEARAAA